MIRELSKTVPEHRKTLRFTACRADFMNFKVFRTFREGMKLPNGGKCGWCNIPFKDADMMGLVIPTHGKNLLLCQECIAMAKDVNDGR